MSLGYYIITHQYSKEAKKTDIYLKSELSEKEIEDIVVSIQFMFEDLVCESRDFSEREFIPFFNEFYELDIEVIEELSIDDLRAEGSFIIKVDRHYARESRCGKKYHELMANPLLKTGEFITMINQIKY